MSGEHPRITVWWCDLCGYWRREQSTGVHITYPSRASKGDTHKLVPVMFEMVHKRDDPSPSGRAEV